MKPSPRRIPCAFVLALVCLGIAGCLGKPRAVQLPRPCGTPSAVCGQCHKAIYDEWRRSGHAQAFTREEFHVATRQHQAEDCLRCHIPVSYDLLDSATVRTENREEGVNCESCHLRGDAYVARRQFTSYADHKVVEEPGIAASEFCGKCHRAIYREWSEAAVAPADRQSCQDCHMPATRRRTVSGSPWHVLHAKAECRHHGFGKVPPRPGTPNVALAASVQAVTPAAVVATASVTNMAAHHSLPSGEFGFRELAVVAALVDRYGVASAKQVTRFVAQRRTVLPYRQPQAVPLRFEDVAEDVEALEVQLVRSSYAGVEAVLEKVRIPLRPARGEAAPAATEK